MSGVLARWPWPVACLFVAVAYLALGLACRPFAMPIDLAATIWPPSAVAVFAVLFGGRRLVPGVAVGAFAVLVSGGTMGEGAARAIGFSMLMATAYGIQAWVGAVLVRRTLALPSAFDDPRDILLLLFWAGPVACAVTALAGPVLVGLARHGGSGPTEILYWWVGEVTGVCVGLPILLALFGPPRAAWRRRRAVIVIPMALGIL